jgi:hypothetical protein
LLRPVVLGSLPDRNAPTDVEHHPMGSRPHQVAKPGRGFPSLVPCGARCHCRAIREANCCRVSQLSHCLSHVRETLPRAGHSRHISIQPVFFTPFAFASLRWSRPPRLRLTVSRRVSHALFQPSPEFLRNRRSILKMNNLWSTARNRHGTCSYFRRSTPSDPAPHSGIVPECRFGG